MAIQKRFIHFKKFSDFNSKKLSANEANTQYTIGVSGAVQNGTPDVLYQSYCWIKDTKQQWTHGQLYDGTDSGAKVYTWNWDGSDSGTLTEEEYNGISEADVVYVNTDGQPSAFIKTCSSSDITLTYICVIDLSEYNSGSFVAQFSFTINSDKTYSVVQTNASIPNKTSQLENDSDFVTSDNIKTINGESILGSGDITIEGGSLTESDIAAMGFTKNTGTYSKPSSGIPKSDLSVDVQSALNAANAYQGTVTNVTINGTTKNPVNGVVDLGNVGTYNKPSTGIPKSDLNSSVQTSLSKADSAVQPEDLQTEVYIADFTMDALRQGMYNSSEVDCNMQDLIDAMTSNKIILVREYEEDAYKGVHVLNGYMEDLLYFSIVDSEGNVLYCEGTDYLNTQNYIDGQSLHMRSWNDKQDNLISGENIKTINGQSLLGSGNITISRAYLEVSHGTNNTTFTITPNIFHIWDEVGTLTLTLSAETSGVANEYIFQFTSGSRPTTLSLPDDIKWTGGETPTIEADKIYQISILKGLGSVLSWSK